MYKLIIPLMCILGLVLGSCAGSDDPDLDTTPPFPPDLVEHLGDVGDAPVNGVELTDENNGIDTVPEGNWIRVSWKPFIDNDLSRVRIWRYDEINPEPVIIDSLDANADFYLDGRAQLNERVWYSYFIDLVDFAGNVARSDTVSYGLLAKPLLLSPMDGETLVPLNARFRWNRSGFASKFRLVLFDEAGNYIYHQDLDVANEEDPLEIIIPNNLVTQHSGEVIRWRIDAFDRDEGMQMFYGSESLERWCYFQ